MPQALLSPWWAYLISETPGGSKDTSRVVSMIDAAKETYHVLMRILTISHFELSNGHQFQTDNLGHIWSLCHHVLASVHDKEASNNEEARKQ